MSFVTPVAHVRAAAAAVSNWLQMETVNTQIGDLPQVDV